MKKLNLWTIVIMAVLLLIPVVVLADATVELGEDDGLSLFYDSQSGQKWYSYEKNVPGTPNVHSMGYDGVLEIKAEGVPIYIKVRSGDHTVKTEDDMTFKQSGNIPLIIAGGSSITFAGGNFIFEPSQANTPIWIKSGGTLTVSGGSVTAKEASEGKGTIDNQGGTINGKIIDIEGGVQIVPADPVAAVESEMTTDYTLDSLYKTLLTSIKDSKGVTVSFVDGNFIFDMEGEDAFISLTKELNLGDFTKGMTVLGVKAVFNYGGNTVTLTGAELIGQFTGSKYRENVRFEGETLLACAYDEGAKRISIAK